MAGTAGRAGKRTNLGRLIVLFALILAALAGQAFAGRKGAEVEVELLDGRRISGELIAVRSGRIIVKSVIADSSIAIAEIDAITVLRDPSGWGYFETLTTLAGGALGYGAATAYARWSYKERDRIPVFAPILGLAGGCILGGMLGRSIEGKDRVFVIGGRSPDEVDKIVAKLRGKARVRDAR